MMTILNLARAKCLHATKSLALFGLLATSLTIAAQDIESVGAGASSDLRKALDGLSQVRQTIEAERIPLARKGTELEQKLIDARTELARAERFQENQLVDLNVLKAEAKRQADEVKFIDSLLSEYARAFRSRLNFAEEPRFVGLFEEMDKAASSPDMSAADRFSKRSVLLTTAAKRNESVLGGEMFDGKALDKQGRVQSGKVALIGPVAMFASPTGETLGVLQQELNKADPTVVEVEPKEREAARALLTAGKGSLVLDATLGNAFKLAALDEGLYEKLAQGGLIMIPLLGLGVAALILAAVKWIQLSRIRLASENDLQTVLRHLEDDKPEQALKYAQSIPGPAGRLLAVAVEHADEKKEYIEEILYEQLLGARMKLERGIAFLALTATTGPLMGLLGTVMGMIATFQVISSFGSGDPKTLAAGISEALICTAAGMGVAIPALLAHAFLSRKAKAILGSMEQTGVGFVNGVPEPQRTTFA